MRQELLLMQYHLSIFFLLGAIGLKFFFASRIFAAYKKGTVSFITCLILLAIFAGQMMCDLAWLNYLGLQIFSLSSNLWIRTISRIAWILNLIHYQAIAYLNENIFVGQYKLSLRQKFFCGITALFLILNFFPLISSPYEYYSWEVPGLRYAMEFYTTFFLILPSFFIALYRFRTVTFPFLIRKQNTVFIKLLGFFTGIDVLRFIFVFLTLNGESLYVLFISLFSSMILTVAVLYYSFRIHHLRFLNMTPFVTMPLNEQLNNELISAYHRFAHVSQQTEIRLILERCIARGLGVADDSIEVTFLSAADNAEAATSKTNSERQKIVNVFFDSHPDFSDLIIKNGLVLIHQDLQFSLWHSGNSFEALGTEFLEKLQADLFVPLAHEDQLFGFAVVRSGARLKQLYSKQEYETLSFWGRYAGQACCRISERIQLAQLRRYKEFEDEVFEYHQRLSRVHDALESIAHTHGKNKIGTLLFRASQFEFMNDGAERLLSINPNEHKGDPIAQMLTKIVRDVLKYKQPLYQLLESSEQKKLACTAQLFCSDSVILFLFPADASDFLAPSLLLATERSDIDYVLCLQTTAQGKLLEQLFPSNQQPFLALKIALLKNALSKRPLWIEGTTDDLLDVAHVLHGISLKERFEQRTVTPETAHKIREQLFFVPAAQLDLKKEASQSLLITLDRCGTLLLENVDLLPREGQQELALFIESGRLQQNKYSEPVAVDVRLFCSGSKPFKELITTHALHPRLEAQFANRVISLPALHDISFEALQEFVSGISKQLISGAGYGHFVSCSRQDIEKLQKELPYNLRALRIAVQKLLQTRSKEFLSSTVVEEIPPQGDQLIVYAARFGKRVLKDEQSMRSLWDRFKNQSKIAELLQVNRSSVSRCLKKLGCGE